jgi:predicted membrane protein
MKNVRNILWGVLLVAVGVILGLNACNITNIDLFFDGWWTLFILVPCTIGLFTESNKTGNLIGLAVGVTLLLICQDILSADLLWKLLAPVILVLIGLRLIFKDVFNRKARQVISKWKSRGVTPKEYAATFATQNVDMSGVTFEGADLTAVFGSLTCDLRYATFTEDVVINLCSMFGGIDVYLPDNVNVKLGTTCIFGGISDKRIVKTTEKAVTVYINGNCIFGGADIK